MSDAPSGRVPQSTACPDYYMRLEQGRENSPSAQVVEAVAVAVRLDQAALDHLPRLTRAPNERRGDPAGQGRVSPQLRTCTR